MKKEKRSLVGGMKKIDEVEYDEFGKKTKARVGAFDVASITRTDNALMSLYNREKSKKKQVDELKKW